MHLAVETRHLLYGSRQCLFVIRRIEPGSERSCAVPDDEPVIFDIERYRLLGQYTNGERVRAVNSCKDVLPALADLLDTGGGRFGLRLWCWFRLRCWLWCLLNLRFRLRFWRLSSLRWLFRLLGLGGLGWPCRLG